LRHAHHVNALFGGQSTAAAPDEHHDGLIGFLDRDRMAQAIISRDVIYRDLTVVMDAGAERDGDADERSRQTKAATETLGCA
jgi:hypothetical protein